MNTNDITLFVRTADNGSITRAAEQLDMSTATASAALKRLEQQLNVQLFVRSTRRLRITAEGERLLVYCREALDQLELGRASIRALQGQVGGELRISAPSDLGRNVLLGWIDEIMEQHDDLSISLLLGDSISDFYTERVDLAIRYGALKDSSMVALKLASVDGVLCAAPEYLATHGAPADLADLKQHNCLMYQNNDRLNDVWEFTSHSDTEPKDRKIRVSSNRTSNDSDVVRRWAIAGKGIVYKSVLDMADDLSAGRVVRILPQYQVKKVDLNLVFPTRRQITPAALILRDILKDRFSDILRDTQC
tara:strand:+ start:2822 stop:3739 length:918 start_codon:yes stop_codon:yes gene_type:complete